MPLTLAKKLRIQIDEDIYLINCPDETYFVGFRCIHELPKEQVKTIVLFVKDLDELVKQTRMLVNEDLLLQGGRILIAYPKMGNKKYKTYIHRDAIFPALQVNKDGFIANSIYKFNQMVKLDDDFTILGLKKERLVKRTERGTQSVANYVTYLPQIEEMLQEDEDAYAIFQGLTYGYQKGWARYVFSAKKAETREKRKQEMLTLLKQGVKAIDLKIR